MNDKHQDAPPPEETGAAPVEAPGEGMPAEPPALTEDFTQPGKSLGDLMPASIVLMMVLAMVYGFTTYNHGFMELDETAYDLGAFDPTRVMRDGEIWRFLTANLLHLNPSHIFNNIAGLFVFGQILEPWIGTPRTILLFIVSGIWSMLFSLFLLQGGTIGISGVNYGEIGCYIGLVLFFRYNTNRELFKQELKSAIIFTVIYAGWNFYQMGTVNIWGHLGGFIAGLLFALWVWEREKKKVLPAKSKAKAVIPDDPLAEILEESPKN